MIAVTIAAIVALGLTLAHASRAPEPPADGRNRRRVFDQEGTARILEELEYWRHANRPRTVGTFRRCAYCGTRSYGRSCAAHRDVAQADRGAARG